MANDDTELASLRRRLECVERRNRLWRNGMFACVLLVGTAALMAAQDASTPNLIAARHFQLKDDAGMVRAALFMNDAKQPAFCLYDERGKERLNVKIQDGPEIWMFDEKGNSRVSLRRTSQEPELALFSKDTNQVMARMTVTEQGGAFAAWTPQNQICFCATPSGTSVRQVLQVLDQNTKVRAEIAKSPTSNAYFKLLDENGTGRIVMFVGEHGENATGLQFLDTNGQQSLLNLGAVNGQTGFIYGSNPSNQSDFAINNTGIAAKTFERRK
ncbi:MAG TPA: hypothetical protein VFG04_23205 [Planctomycetaceae bacterium]|jgi:hypothetical protein|nr:hypothetical protein [Planctomycetaceae bacterium]